MSQFIIYVYTSARPLLGLKEVAIHKSEWVQVRTVDNI
jgi:hypothetical protein